MYMITIGLRGFKQTHQPSPWINDYGMFAIMPVKGMKINEEERASWFSHKAEVAKPYYYSVYLAEHDIIAEITPTDRAAYFRFTFPETDDHHGHFRQRNPATEGKAVTQAASAVINNVALVMKAGLDYSSLRDQIYTHPSMSEALNDLFSF